MFFEYLRMAIVAQLVETKGDYKFSDTPFKVLKPEDKGKYVSTMKRTFSFDKEVDLANKNIFNTYFTANQLWNDDIPISERIEVARDIAKVGLMYIEGKSPKLQNIDKSVIDKLNDAVHKKDITKYIESLKDHYSEIDEIFDLMDKSTLKYFTIVALTDATCFLIENTELDDELLKLANGVKSVYSISEKKRNQKVQLSEISGHPELYPYYAAIEGDHEVEDLLPLFEKYSEHKNNEVHYLNEMDLLLSYYIDEHQDKKINKKVTELTAKLLTKEKFLNRLGIFSHDFYFMYRTAYFFYCLGKHFDSKILLKIFKHLFSGDVKFLMRRALYFAIAGIRLGLRERSDMNEDDVNKFFKSLDEIGIDTTRIIKVLKSKKELEKVEDFSDREKEHFEMLADDLMGSKYKNVFEEAKEVAELSYYFYNMLKQKEEFTKSELSIFIEPGFVNHLFQLVTNHPTLGIIQDYIDSLENTYKRLKEYEKYINKYTYNFDLYMRYIEELIKSRNRNKIPKVLEKGYKKLTEVLPEELTPIHVEDENMGMYVLLLLNWYSGVLVEENQLSKAQKALELSQRLDPEDIFSTKDQQMKIYLEKGNFEDLKKVLKFSHLENVSEAMNAALLYYHTGEYDYAEKIVFDALDNNPFILDILLYEDPREAVRALQDKREFDDDIVSEAVDYSFKFRKHWVIEKALKWLKNIKDVFDEIR
jgi:hypothetical protein